MYMSGESLSGIACFSPLTVYRA